MSNKGERRQHKTLRTSKSTKVGLVFPVGRIARFLKIGWYSNRVGAGAPVYLAPVLEYLTAKVLELVGDAARDRKKKRIKPHHIQLVVKNDIEMEQMFQKIIIPFGGVRPHIRACLLP